MKLNKVVVLLIEANPSDAKFCICALKKSKTIKNIVLLENGLQALNFIFGKGESKNIDLINKPTLILLDIKTPNVDGIEVLERIRSDKRTKQIPVIILTSSNEDKDRKKCYSLGANSYIVKPIRFDDYIKTVVEMLLLDVETIQNR